MIRRRWDHTPSTPFSSPGPPESILSRPPRCSVLLCLPCCHRCWTDAVWAAKLWVRLGVAPCPSCSPEALFVRQRVSVKIGSRRPEAPVRAGPNHWASIGARWLASGFGGLDANPTYLVHTSDKVTIGEDPLRGVGVTEVLTLRRQVAEGFSERLEHVRSDDWSLPTCCERWDVTELVDHAIGAQRMVPKALGATGDIDVTGKVWYRSGTPSVRPPIKR